MKPSSAALGCAFVSLGSIIVLLSAAISFAPIDISWKLLAESFVVGLGGIVGVAMFNDANPR